MPRLVLQWHLALDAAQHALAAAAWSFTSTEFRDRARRLSHERIETERLLQGL